jgi:hypothetical protein
VSTRARSSDLLQQPPGGCKDIVRADPPQAPEIAGLAHALIARPARQRAAFHNGGGTRAGRHGVHSAGSVGPNNATIGTSVAAAMCIGPLSPPTNSAARSIRART